MGCQIKLKRVYALAGNRACSAIESLTDIPLASPKDLIVLLSAHHCHELRLRIYGTVF